MRRAFVPTALHRQLEEHASLVRVLRTARVLDLTTHLIRNAAAAAAAADDDDDNAWTSWPLIDCPVPEWSLEDEIHNLAETVARDDPPGSDPDYDSDSDPSTASHRLLVLHAAAILAHILNLLADQRPSAPGSMQNRLWPMNWEDVIALLAVSGVLDPSIVARAEKRLERIYGPSSTKAIERRARATSARSRSAALAAKDEDILLTSPVLAPRTRRSVGKATRRESAVKVKSSAVVDTDSDDA